MRVPAIGVTAHGAVKLGDKVVCDGFVHGMPYRVQTHVHDDHMEQFDTSKGFQDILMTEETRALLIAEHNADLPYRANVRVMEPGIVHPIEDFGLKFVPSGHMLGAVQVAVTLPDGFRMGYSGDFQWPGERVIEVDALVLDSTYGSPDSRRKYSQEEANERFLQLVLGKLGDGPVVIKAHRGTLQRAMDLLDGATAVPVVASPKLCKEAAVYEKYGYGIPQPLLRANSPEGRQAITSRRYIRFLGKGENELAYAAGATTITLSAYMVNGQEPVLEFSQRAYRVAMSDHADFDGTLEYVRATGAKFVVTDNRRGGHAAELAIALYERLGVEARPSSDESTHSWGK